MASPLASSRGSSWRVRALQALVSHDDDLTRHINLRSLQDSNEVPFYRIPPECVGCAYTARANEAKTPWPIPETGVLGSSRYLADAGVRARATSACGFGTGRESRGLMGALGCPGFGGVGGLDLCRCHWLIAGFELEGCEDAKGGVPTLAVVEDLEVFEDRVGQLDSCAPAPVGRGARPACGSRTTRSRRCRSSPRSSPSMAAVPSRGRAG